MGINLIEEVIERAQDRKLRTREQEIKQIIEALLFTSSEALSLERIKDIVTTSFPIRSKELQILIEELQREYSQSRRAFEIASVGGGYLLQTLPEMRGYVELLHKDRRPERLTQSATEVLAIIAFKGPITRREVEGIRGVDSSGTMQSLIERGLITAVGRRETPGRPNEYGVTKQFLHHYGLNNLEELTYLMT